MHFGSIWRSSIEYAKRIALNCNIRMSSRSNVTHNSWRSELRKKDSFGAAIFKAARCHSRLHLEIGQRLPSVSVP